MSRPDVVCCPRCAGALGAHEAGFGCTRCTRAYPMIGRVPLLVEDPALWRTTWLRRLRDFVTGVALRVAGLRQEAEGPDILPRTRRRLLAIAGGLAQQAQAVAALFAPVGEGPDELVATAIPGPPELGPADAVLACYEHIFRDWVWGQRECDQVLSLVAPLVPQGLERLAVYGAGAGRLAVELHQRCAPARTLALDVNPLPYLVADRLLAGETVTLPEFPVDPRSDEVVVVPRDVSLPSPVRQGLTLLFADALRPPIPAGSLDAVVTSWFIDVAPADLRQTAAAINRVLRPGGVWVSLGPLRFQSQLARAYRIEEVHEIVAASGFALTTHDRHDLPYFDSPVGGSRRIETAFRFAARRTREAPAVEMPPSVPPWVSNVLLPIPITPELMAVGRTAMLTSGLLSLIDGQRNVVEVARALAVEWAVDAGRLQDELRAFLAKVAG